VICLVQATGIDATRNAFAAAGTSLASGVDGMASIREPGWLPWIFGEQRLAALDSRLHDVSGDLWRAVDHLDGVRFEPGAGEEGIRNAQRAISEAAEFVDRRRAIEQPRRRWKANPGGEAWQQSLGDLAAGLQAAGESGDLDSAVARRLGPFVPRGDTRFDPAAHAQVMSVLSASSLPLDEARRHAFWVLLQQPALFTVFDRQPAAYAGDLRDMLVMVRPGAGDALPAWLARAGEDLPLGLNDQRAAELERIAWPDGFRTRHAMDVVDALLSGADGVVGIRRAIAVSSRLIDAIPAEGPRAVMRTELSTLAHRNLERTSLVRTDGHSGDPDYAEIGRAIAIAQFLQKTSAPPATQVEQARKLGATLTW
jgi:hypothetical protein